MTGDTIFFALGMIVSFSSGFSCTQKRNMSKFRGVKTATQPLPLLKQCRDMDMRKTPQNRENFDTIASTVAVFCRLEEGYMGGRTSFLFRS